MCENTGTGPALDVMAFTLSHSTNARNALSLYEAANGKTGKTVEDVILPVYSDEYRKTREDDA